MNAARALVLKSGDVLVAVHDGRALVMLGDENDLLVPYRVGERAYVVRADVDSPEAVRVDDNQPLGRINLRNWEPVTRCDACLAEYDESRLRECGSCGIQQCGACVSGHSPCGSGYANGRRPVRQSVLSFKAPKISNFSLPSKKRQRRSISK